MTQPPVEGPDGVVYDFETPPPSRPGAPRCRLRRAMEQCPLDASFVIEGYTAGRVSNTANVMRRNPEHEGKMFTSRTIMLKGVKQLKVWRVA